jgi:hypothetical protein
MLLLYLTSPGSRLKAMADKACLAGQRLDGTRIESML